MASRRARWVMVALALGFATALARPARGEDAAADEPVARERLATQILEAATVRMRAKAAEARLLEAAGRPKEALVALGEVATIHDEALALVRHVLASRPATAARRPAAPRRTSPPVPFPPNPDDDTGLPPEHEPRRPATHDPVPAAVAFLRSCQREDGWFSAARGQRPDLGDGAMEDGRDAALTAFAVLAILDASEDDAPALGAVRDAANAIAAEAASDRDIGGSGTAHVLASWALAAAYARLGEPAWRDPLRRAVGRYLLSSDGHYVRGTDAPDDDFESAIWCLGLLYECLPLRATLEVDTIEVAIDELEDAYGRADPALARGASGIAALLFRLHGAGGLVGRRAGDVPPLDRAARGWATDLAKGATDPAVLLLGTVLFVGLGDPVEELHWWNRALIPALTRQVLEGPAAGSWPPTAAGRAWATAATLLAWKADAPVWREPVAR